MTETQKPTFWNVIFAVLAIFIYLGFDDMSVLGVLYLHVLNKLYYYHIIINLVAATWQSIWIFPVGRSFDMRIVNLVH